METVRRRFSILGVFLGVALLFGFAFSVEAAPPVVKTVPWVATNPLIPHDTYAGKSIRLKGTSDIQGANIQYSWDFGDGTPVATGIVTNQYVIEALHTYAGAVGTVWTARLTVQNTSTGETGNQTYYVKMEPKNLAVEVNVAIDEGLWYLHKTMRRFTSSGVDLGDWVTGGNASSGYVSNTAANLNAFFVNGHLETGAATNPYTETAKRGMRRLFEGLQSFAISNQTYPAPIGTVNPDMNGNGIGLQVYSGPSSFNGTDPPYQGGMVMDAIVASGTPNAVTTTGGTNVVGRAYKDIVQDMVDAYLFGQGNTGTYYGGWRYGWNYGGDSDNSTNQWAAVGIIAAQLPGWATVPAWVKTANLNSVSRTQAVDGSFGYTNSTSGVGWGPYALTPSGLVQMVMDGKGRGFGQWDLAENFLRTNFCNTGSATAAIRDYYYGLFSFTKAMLLHDSNGDGIAEPIVFLQNTGGANPLDWYSAEASAGAPCDGVARTLIGDQNVAGYWYNHNVSGSQFTFETAWAIIMLNRTVFESGVPVAVAKALPNPAVAGQLIQLDGSDSFHQDASKLIDSWEWDLDNNGTYETSGPFPTVSFPAVGDYVVKLRVTDNASPEASATTSFTVRVTIPPLAPTANAGGPYNFCENRKPWFLDGNGSVNPDEGQSEPGSPGDTIIAYDWDLDGNGQFDNASGPTPDVTGYFTGLGFGSYLIQLRVTDNTAASFPSSGMGNLSDTDSAQVVVRAGTDPACVCVENLSARRKLNKAELRWTWKAGVHHYNVYRGTVSGGPYLKIAEVSTGTGFYLDSGPLATGVTYYYVIREAALNGNELCQSNQATCPPATR